MIFIKVHVFFHHGATLKQSQIFPACVSNFANRSEHKFLPQEFSGGIIIQDTMNHLLLLTK